MLQSLLPEGDLWFLGIFGKPNNICIRVWLFLGSRMIFVFVFGHQNTIRSPLVIVMITGIKNLGPNDDIITNGQGSRNFWVSSAHVH